MLNDTHSRLCLAGSQSQWSPSWPSPVWFCPAPSGSSVWPWNLRYLNESDFCSITFFILHFVFYSTNSYLCNYYYPPFPIENNTLFLQVFFQKTYFSINAVFQVKTEISCAFSASSLICRLYTYFFLFISLNYPRPPRFPWRSFLTPKTTIDLLLFNFFAFSPSLFNSCPHFLCSNKKCHKSHQVSYRSDEAIIFNNFNFLVYAS